MRLSQPLELKEKKNISRETARKWLHQLGWDYKDHSKNIYFDGHERDDVVAYRNRFLKQMTELQPRIGVYERENINQIISPILAPNVLELVPIIYDKSIFYANNGV